MDKMCIKCNEIKELIDFDLRSASPDGYTNTCRMCRRERVMLRSKEPKHIKETFPEGFNRCIGPCGEIKPLNDFPIRRGSPNGHKSECIICSKKRCHEYYLTASPEEIEKRNARG